MHTRAALSISSVCVCVCVCGYKERKRFFVRCTLNWEKCCRCSIGEVAGTMEMRFGKNEDFFLENAGHFDSKCM